MTWQVGAVLSLVRVQLRRLYAHTIIIFKIQFVFENVFPTQRHQRSLCESVGSTSCEARLRPYLIAQESSDFELSAK